MKKVGGEWLEGHRVTVSIDGGTYTRVVRYNRADGLYITIRGYKYFEYECE